MKLNSIWSRAAPALILAKRRTVRTITLYLDDLFWLAGCGCFIRAAWQQWGQTAALAVAGICCVATAMLVAKARRGGDC